MCYSNIAKERKSTRYIYVVELIWHYRVIQKHLLLNGYIYTCTWLASTGVEKSRNLIIVSPSDQSRIFFSQLYSHSFFWINNFIPSLWSFLRLGLPSKQQPTSRAEYLQFYHQIKSVFLYLLVSNIRIIDQKGRIYHRARTSIIPHLQFKE